jgi:hypothetical protein
MTVDMRDIYWLAGILEGEGCFTYSGCTPMVQLQMLDTDIVERAARIMGTKVGRRKRLTPNGHIVWFTQASGGQAVGIMETIYLLLGVRRRETIRKRISQWRPASRLGWTMVHQMRVMHAGGMTAAAVARHFGVNRERAGRAIRGERWSSPFH